MATSNVHNFSAPYGVNTCPHRGFFSVFSPWAISFVLLSLVVSSLNAATEVNSDWASKRAEKTYQQLRAQWQKTPTGTAIAVDFSRACFEWAEFARTNPERRKLAEEGMEAARQILNKNPKLGAAWYYMALNRGQLARSDKLGALSLLRPMEQEFQTAEQLDPKYDHAGPTRTLGLLYRDAPGWPISLGSRHKAKDQLLKSVQIAPEYPDNWLYLLESYLEWGEKQQATVQLPTVEKKIEEAREKFTGEAWAWKWHDWDQRWERLKTRAGAPKAESPKSRN